jgi:hypothetical protein
MDGAMTSTTDSQIHVRAAEPADRRAVSSLLEPEDAAVAAPTPDPGS